MKKRIISIILSLSLATACFVPVPLASAKEGQDGSDFVAGNHLIKVADNKYQIVSLDKNTTMNLFVNDAGKVSYNLQKTAATSTTEVLKVGDLDADEKVTVSDVVALRSLIMKGSSTDKQKLISDLDGDKSITVSDVVALRSQIMAGKPAPTVEYTTTSEKTTSWVGDSLMGVTINDTNYFSGASISKAEVSEINRTYSHNGNQSEITDSGVAATFTMSSNRYTYYIDARVYNNGIAFRYRFPAADGSTQRTVNSEFTNFALRSDIDKVWHGDFNQDYEATIGSYNPNQASAMHITAPITAELAGGAGYLSLQEAGVTDSYAGTNYVAKGNCVYQVSNTMDADKESKSYTVAGDITTGWRLVNIADTLNELVNNYNVYNVNEAPDSALFSDTSWIEPGRSAWSWLTDYGSSLGTADAMYTYTENASRLGFEYNVIDEGYTKWSNYQNELKTLGQYGESLNVKQILWAQVSTNGKGFKMTNVAEAKTYLDFLKDNHLYGGKIDFWWSEAAGDRINNNNTALQESILKMAAERQLIINFHGCNKPAGLDATYPNELTREAIRGLENISSAQNKQYSLQADWLTKQLFTRYLSGHGDWTPACNTAMQIASLICIDSPLNVIATNPEHILANEAVEMIKSIPTVWDATKVLSNSKIGETAVYAKETNNVWYLGGIINGNKTVSVSLDEFLGDGQYSMELWSDTADGNKVKTVKTVTKNDILDLGSFTAGKGFAARFTKLSLNQYGGEIIFGEPVVLTTLSSGSVVKYTTDGSDPMTSTTAVKYTGPVQLTETCKFKAAIVSGDGAGTMVSYNFNLVGGKSISQKITYGESTSTVKLYTNFNCKMYYTTDGSEPTAASAQYTVPFLLNKTSTVKVLGVPVGGGDTVTKSFDVFVNPAQVTPDVYLDANYTSSHTDWGSIKMNKNLEGDPIYLGGTTATNGTKYDYGFGLNAEGYLVYNIPVGATQFAGVVGIDDRTWNSNDGALASSTLSVLFDGVEYYKSPVFRRGEVYNILADIPEGAKEIKIVIGNGGDDITCDNVSVGNAGWVMGDKTHNEITRVIEEKTGYTNVTLSANFNGKIYYTIDDSEPTTESAGYTGAIKVTSSCTVKILGIPDDGSDNVTDSFDVTVVSLNLTPDVYLGTDYTKATTGWSGDPVSVNKNTKGGKISIAGIQYDRGIATNANGIFEYNVPANAVKFVGIVGVDDAVYQNANDGHKASITCAIYFDGNKNNPVYTSGKMTRGDFDTVFVDVPAGAKKITIDFGDAGDGITCDNASMGNAGWIINIPNAVAYSADEQIGFTNVTLTPNFAGKVYYTTDGSDPTTGSAEYTAALKLTQSCTLKVLGVPANGGDTVKKSFTVNVSQNKVTLSADAQEGHTTVTLTPNFTGKVYYTTDGSDPTTDSAEYTSTVRFLKNCTLKVLGVPDNGSDNTTVSFTVIVTPKSTPDLYLGADYLDGRTDWSKIFINQNSDGGKISLGGTSAGSGTKYDHGFSMNAKGYLLYNVPNGATQFMGVVGIDDVAWNNANDGGKASATLSVLFDGVECYSSSVFKRGEFYEVRVDVPEGAKQIKIVLGDAGDGITCDNVSMGNPGWVFGYKTQNEISFKAVQTTGFTTVTLAPNFNGKMYYTTDGSEPTTESAGYTKAINIPVNCTLKVLGVPDDGSDNAIGSFDVTVIPYEFVPDLFLGTDYISATTGWSGDPAKVNTNTKGGLISIAGIRYLHGLATNAIGEFVYNVPTNATEFVGIVGVDDVVSQNVNDGHKASITFSVYFDDSTVAAYTSATLTPGKFEKIQVAVPQGVSKIRIYFGDAGNGNTCDNGSIGNAGWMLAAD